jgi:gamma-glutamylcyclotransferase (GGCT)/AIG2-like uncharacterized protein YtfP
MCAGSWGPDVQADGIFLYGTLREGGRDHAWLRRTDPEGTTRAYAPGRLFHLPAAGHPAMVAQEEPSEPPPGPGWVAGEFAGYGDEAALEGAIQDLDALEGVETGLYLRVLLPVILDSGHRFTAWAHVFPPDRIPRLEREAVELPSGDWNNYLVH